MSAETTTKAAAAEPVLEAVGLAVGYGRTRVIEDLTLAVPRGSVYALLGRNGAGKSSLLRVLVGQRPPMKGTVRLLGQDPWTRRTSLMSRVGVVPEEPDAPPEMTALQLSSFCARLHARWDAAAVADRLRRFEVPLDRACGRLSKGQKGALMLSLALGHSPELLLLDDPTLGLDVVARDAVFQEVIGDLADRVSTHDLRAIEGIADHVAILHGRRLALAGRLEALKADRGQSLEQIFASVAGTRAADAPFTEARS
jgi:ABC-2 type transport system ATP-binding protein